MESSLLPVVSLELPKTEFDATPPKITWGKEELTVWVKTLTDKYKDLVIETDADIKAAKDDRASLNKIITRMDEARKRAVEQASGPIADFEREFKALVQQVRDASAYLDKHVKSFEDMERAGREQDIMGMIDKAKKEHNVPDCNVIVPVAWTNKTTTKTAIKEGILAQIDKYKQDKEQNRLLEQAKKERAAAIEKEVQLLGVEYGFEIPVATFILHMNNLEKPLSDSFKDVRDVFEQQKAKLDAQAKVEEERLSQVAMAASKPTTEPEPEQKADSKPDQPAQAADPVVVKELTITGQYNGARAEQVRSALEGLNLLMLEPLSQETTVSFAISGKYNAESGQQIKGVVEALSRLMTESPVIKVMTIS